MSDLTRYLDVVKYCPHCKQKLSCCHAPSIHVGDGLGWGSEVLFICLNDSCSVFVNGWVSIEKQYGHHSSYRYMETPNSKEKNYMMVGSSDAFKGSEVEREDIEAQNKRYHHLKEMTTQLSTCVEEKNISAPLEILLEEAAAKERREEAAKCLTAIGDLAIIDPIRNHNFRDPAIEHAANTTIKGVLKKNFKKECPFCAELIKEQAKKCMHCQSDLS